MSESQGWRDRRRLLAGRRESDPLIEHLVDGVVIVGPTGRIHYLNPAAKRLLDPAGPAASGDAFPLDLPPEGRAEIDLQVPGRASRLVEIRTIDLQQEDDPAVLVMLRDVTERRDAEEKLHRALLDTVVTVARMIEKRDPYTAGHQNRTAELALAIGRSLGWPSDRLLAIEMSALVHDVGKVHIPSEILTRPGRLSAEEYHLVKTHALVGHDILREADLPWPVADIARSHHERLDGSGYPDGLAGDAIPPEALVVAVADVVEAITAHRPYRASMGVEAALAEIERGRGILYDADTVDACVKLFREEGFEWRTR